MKKRERREYQKFALVAVRETRMLALLWGRRGRKSTTLGEIAFDELSRGEGRMVIGASASLLLGREMTTMALSASEAAAAVASESEAVRAVFEESAPERGLEFKVANAATGKVVKGWSAADFTDLYQSSKLELRLYHSDTGYARLQVVAPNPATMRGWRGLVMFDEFGYVATNLAQELIDAADPMMRDVADLKMIFACNMPTDDRHPWFEMTLPRELTAGSEEEQFPAHPEGHLYRSQTEMLVHRVALKDMYAAGHLLYDNEGQPMTYDQCLRFPAFRSSLDVSYRLLHKAGGTSVIDLFALTTAMRRGIERQCGFFFVETDRDFEQALAHLRNYLGEGEVGIGADIATTTGESSNPTSVTITERRGVEYLSHVLIWKTRDARVQRERFAGVIKAIKGRRSGKAARRMCIDSTNEQLFARETRDELGGLVPIELVDARNAVEPEPAGYARTPNYKTWLGDLYAGCVNDNRSALPSDAYLKEDHRIVMKDKGLFVCEPMPDGKHGDTFDSGKLALHALNSSGGAITEELLRKIFTGGNSASLTSPHHEPRRLRT
jgi:hypothetical protein